MLKKLFLEIACLLQLDRLAERWNSAILYSRRRRYEKILGYQLTFIYQGAGDIHLAGDITKFRIGSHSHLKTNTFIECSGGVTIGDYLHSARGLTIFSTRHNWKNTTTIPYDPISTSAPVTIGNFVWIGSNVTILPGSTIGNGVIIGAGSVIRGEIQDGAVVIGNPAQIINQRDMNQFWEMHEKKAFF